MTELFLWEHFGDTICVGSDDVIIITWAVEPFLELFTSDVCCAQTLFESL